MGIFTYNAVFQSLIFNVPNAPVRENSVTYVFAITYSHYCVAKDDNSMTLQWEIGRKKLQLCIIALLYRKYTTEATTTVVKNDCMNSRLATLRPIMFGKQDIQDNHHKKL